MGHSRFELETTGRKEIEKVKTPIQDYDKDGLQREEDKEEG